MNRRTLLALAASGGSMLVSDLDGANARIVKHGESLVNSQEKKPSLQTDSDLDSSIVDIVCEWLKNNGATAEISVSISGIPESGRTLYFIPKENRVLRWGAPFYSTFHEKIFPGKDDWVLKTY